MSEQRVHVAVSDHVATVTLTRPDKHNALDIEMFEAIIDAAEQVSLEPRVRAVVLHGDGPSFCSGLDVASLMSSRQSLDEGLTEDAPNWFQRTAYDWIRVPVPVIAAISAASAKAESSGWSEVRVTTPSAAASVPLNTRPVYVSSLATSIGTCRGSVRVIDMSGIRPHLTSITDNRASGAAIRMSAPSAI